MLLNNTAPGAATPSFAAQQSFATAAVPVSVWMADFNGDGRPDLAVANNIPAFRVGPAQHADAIHRRQARPPAQFRTTTRRRRSPSPPAITKAPTSLTAFATALAVDVRNVNNNLVQGVSVTFSTPLVGPTGTFGGSLPVLTDASGRATAPTFTANGLAGQYVVSAIAAGGSNPSINFNLTNTDGGDRSPSIRFGSTTAVPSARDVTTLDVTFSTQVTFAGAWRARSL